MTDQTNPPPSTYIIDTSGTAEIARLIEQDRFVTQAMGNLFPRAFSDQIFEEGPIRVLDIACGPGSWVLEIAYAYPGMQVTGIDCDPDMIAYARARARTQNRSNASFHVMDVTRPLDFSDGTFDFVAGRFLNSFLTRDTWPDLVQECVRATKPGGWLRFTECDELGRSNSLTLQEVEQLLREAWHADPLPRVWPITPHLGQFLHDAGCQHIQELPHLLNFSAPWEPGSAQAARHHAVCENLRVGLTLLQPYLLRQQVITPTLLQALLERLTQEVYDPGFRALWSLVSVLGQKPHPHSATTGLQHTLSATETPPDASFASSAPGPLPLHPLHVYSSFHQLMHVS